MKFTIDYDVLEQIRQSKNGYRIKRYLTGGFCGVALGMSAVVPFWIYFVQNGKNIIPSVILSGTGGGISVILSSKYLQKLNMESAKQYADFKLRLFVNQLYNIEVRTTAELLKDAKLNRTKYKIVYSDENAKLPKLKQFKYIDIPLSNGYEETILQEHVFGDEDYEISVQSPIKKHQFKLAQFKLTKASMGA